MRNCIFPTILVLFYTTTVFYVYKHGSLYGSHDHYLNGVEKKSKWMHKCCYLIM